MAKKDKKDLSHMNPNLNKKLIQRVQDELDTSYRQTYFSDNDDLKNINAIKQRIDKDLTELMDKNKLRNNGNSISNMYARTLATNDDNTFSEFRKALQDETMLADLMDMYSQNAIQRDMDREIDVVCKYVPKLQKALDLKAKHVLSADHFNRDSMKISLITDTSEKISGSVPEEIEKGHIDESDISAFKKKYNLVKLTKKIYEKTAKYGEEMIYVVSYNKALKRLLKKSQMANGIISESGVLNEETINNILHETCETIKIGYLNSNYEHEKNKFKTSILAEDFYDFESFSPDIQSFIESNDNYDTLEIEFNNSGVIPSMISERQSAIGIMEHLEAIHEADNSAITIGKDTFLSNSNYLKNMNKEFAKFAKEKGKFKTPTNLNVDGFTEINRKRKKKEETIDIPGCIVKSLDHTMVHKMCIDSDICMGYIYVEADKQLTDYNQTTFSSTLGGLKPRRSTRDKENMQRPTMDEQALEKIAKKIAQKIDAKFINANQDLAKEIYAILKYNADKGNSKVSKIRVSFIPPEDIVHSYFALNEKTNRGISDLRLALFPAKLLSCLYISNVIALLTRGYDKRAYYVKQSVDTNIHGVLLNVISQIKRSNFNLRQIENMNNILNITGRFNDLVIPQNQNGESPISFEIIPGQNIEVKTEFMRSLEETAIMLAGATVEMLETSDNSQTATHLTMTNARFLIDVYERQMIMEDVLSELFTKIYQIEYGTDDILKVKLPPPAMLNFTNTSQILTVANELIQNILTMKLGMENQPNDDVELRATYAGKLMEYYFKDFLPIEDIQRMFDEAKIELTSKKGRPQPAQQDQNGMGQY